ncbi:MAG TPA: nucleoside triphosphate pyrophosphohydrolase [Cerasibacillus sp.]|uniref:nucleoside triphosphate pyrophosphohydrolase n=1 Tax=Cerasibacillus sp. TaxID=2498711 RepID=UPI002F3E6898
MHKIEVLGLGAGDIEQLPLGLYKKLIRSDKPIYVRTLEHPVIETLSEEGVQFISFDYLYKQATDFQVVYEQMADTLIEHVKKESLIYAVPGHPMLAEKTVQLLLQQTDYEVDILGGQSYLDDLFTSLKIDPIDGFQFIDGTSFERRQLDYRSHLIFCQVYDQFIASDVKLALLEDLPPDYPVTIIDAAGSKQERIETVPLEVFDHSFQKSNLTSVYVPPVHKHELNHHFYRLKEVIHTLRSPNGCPWDRKQTHESLREYALEEVYELIEAINSQDDDLIVEELGDLLLQVMLHSQIGEDVGYFTIDDVIRTLTEKMIYRHPHVFGDREIENMMDISKEWEELKQEEAGKENRNSILDGIPKQMPALLKSYTIQKKAAKVGFTWDHVDPVWDKLSEELKEVKEAIQTDDKEEIEIEFGDVFFVLANLARYYQIHPEIALNRANEKFISRFSYIEKKLSEKQKDIKYVSFEEMDMYWDEAKRKES